VGGGIHGAGEVQAEAEMIRTHCGAPVRARARVARLGALAGLELGGLYVIVGVCARR
jgi:hypothetical protein